ncbi:hypothetical protein F8388_006282 [Cannabis sativa]|uniref:Uncharacterized protein n=1 Tax=Cannabis sativa TaxID=3483 RepID=A0A7J6G767_CANSA|nr:hypothetical protein F8388_006282 [Cannabis sativa]
MRWKSRNAGQPKAPTLESSNQVVVGPIVLKRNCWSANPQIPSSKRVEASFRVCDLRAKKVIVQ